jgi:hypothetical protein
MQPNRHYLTILGALTLTAGLVIIGWSLYSRGHTWTIPFAYSVENIQRGGGAQSDTKTTFHLQAALTATPTTAAPDDAFAIEVTLKLIDVTMKNGVQGREESVRKHEVKLNGKPLTLDDISDWWNSIEVRLAANGSTVQPDEQELSLDGNLGKAHWSLAAQKPGKVNLDAYLRSTDRNKLDWNQIHGSVEVTTQLASRLQTVAGPCVTFLGSLATLPGILTFIKERKNKPPTKRHK